MIEEQIAKRAAGGGRRGGRQSWPRPPATETALEDRPRPAAAPKPKIDPGTHRRVGRRRGAASAA